MHQDIIKNKIREFIEQLPFERREMNIVDDVDGSVWISIETGDSRFFIGRDGETLGALNHIARKIAEKHTPPEATEFQFIIDVNGYQKKRIDSLKATAHMMAERARFFKSSIAIDPMSSYERRIIHTFLQDVKDIETLSEGEGKDRHIVIKYVIKEDENFGI